MNAHKILTSSIVLSLVLLLAPAASQAQDAGASGTTPDAFVWLSRQGIGLILGGSTGGGRIHFDGDDHTFRMSGIKFGALGGLGETRMSGEIYGLQKLEDFAGSYKESTAGMSVIVGSGGVWLENDKGVKMHLKAESKGVGIDLSFGSVEIKLGMID